MVFRGLSIELIKGKGGKSGEERGKEGLKGKGVAHGLPDVALRCEGCSEPRADWGESEIRGDGAGQRLS